MKRVFIVVEGQTEETFVKELLQPYFASLGFHSVTPVKIQTSKRHKGGFVNYQHLKNDLLRLLNETNVIVTTFVDFFRIPNNLPNYEICMKQVTTSKKVACLEENMRIDIQISNNFIPYIQQHEFESLIFSSSKSYTFYYSDKVVTAIENIIDQYETPEDINDMPLTAPSKRLLAIIPDYSKVNDGTIIALEIGLENILQQCPRFRNWVETLIIALQ